MRERSNYTQHSVNTCQSYKEETIGVNDKVSMINSCILMEKSLASSERIDFGERVGRKS